MGVQINVVLHGGLQMLVWLYMIPTSVYIIQQKFENYFTYHQRINLLAALAVLVSILLVAVGSGNDDDGGGDDGGNGAVANHPNTGWTVFTMMYFQMFIGLFRPHKGDTPQRRVWFILHRMLGYSTPLFAVYQVVTGWLLAGDSMAVVLEVFIPIVFFLHAVTYFFFFKNATKDALLKDGSTMNSANQSSL